MHLEHVTKAFEILRQHQFFVKLNKCAFGLQELEYLGHIVTSQGVKVDQNKIMAMLNWPRPTNVSELRGFFRPYRLLPKICSELRDHCSASYQSAKEGQIRVV